MKYYEVLDPYYALIRAEDEEAVKRTYTEVISDEKGDEIEIREVSRDYALLMFGLTPIDTEGTHAEPAAIIKLFNTEDNRILLIDGSLA